MAYFVACCQTIVAKLDKLLVRQGPTGVTGKRLFVYLFKGNRPFILDGADDHHEFSNKFKNDKLELS